jgi:hypothetical protein
MTIRQPFLYILIAAASSAFAVTSAQAAPKPKCGFNGDYSFFFWNPNASERPTNGVGFFSVQLNPATKCRSGVVLPGGILNCFVGPEGFEDFVEDGFVFLETDGEGTMEIETNSSNGICGTGDNAIELDVSLVRGGKGVLFNSNGAEFAGSGVIPQAGYHETITGRADKCFAGDISGCYDVRFWSGAPPLPTRLEVDDPVLSALVGDCTICVSGGFVTGGTCRCHLSLNDGSFETLSEIETGGYTLGEDCQSSTGFLTFTTSSDEVCDLTSTVIWDFAVAQQGNELVGACDNTNTFGCAFEGWRQ